MLEQKTCGRFDGWKKAKTNVTSVGVSMHVNACPDIWRPKKVKMGQNMFHNNNATKFNGVKNTYQELRDNKQKILITQLKSAIVYIKYIEKTVWATLALSCCLPMFVKTENLIKHDVRMNTKASHSFAAFGPKLKSSKRRNFTEARLGQVEVMAHIPPMLLHVYNSNKLLRNPLMGFLVKGDLGKLHHYDFNFYQQFIQSKMLRLINSTVHQSY
uniref:Uncharacterized protein n=1 Tax=Glossina austeni TaxID=7395 RepID=A0A1A9V592_GLOAU